jgi:hypothetical protein
MQFSQAWRSPWLWCALVVALALGLRFYQLPHIFLWTDETGFGYGPGYFNENVYGNPPMSLYDFAWKLNKQDPLSTNTWGWPAIVWVTCRLFGGYLTAARIPGVIVDTLFVLLVFVLTWRLLPTALAGRTAVAAGAATLAALSMPQMEFSQRVLPYVSVSCMAAAILLAHINLWWLISQREKLLPRLGRAVALYTAAGCVALCMHPSLSFLLAVSMMVLASAVIGGFARRTREEKRRIFKVVAAASPFFACFVLLNAKSVHSGYHAVLAPYYHRLALESIPKLIFHAYDLAAYHLNLFYNPALYLPNRLNPVLIFPALLCALGCVLAATGKFGPRVRHFAILAFAALCLTAFLSIGRIHVFPFGGTRQTLFLSPFLFVFTALGAWGLYANRLTKYSALGAAVLYAALWAVNLPRFYHDRLESYTGADLLRIWQQNGRLPIFVNEYSRGEIRYALRDHSEIPYFPPQGPPPPTASYLMISTHAPLGDPYWLPAMKEWYEETRSKVTLVAQRPAAHPQTQACLIGCLYNPPSGLWVYRIEPSDWEGASRVSYHALFVRFHKYF